MLIISISILFGVLFSKTHCEEVTEVYNHDYNEEHETEVEISSLSAMESESSSSTVTKASSSSTKDTSDPTDNKKSSPCPLTCPKEEPLRTSHNERFEEIDWFKDFKIPFWFYSANYNCDFSSVTIPLLYLAYQTHRSKGYTPKFDIPQFRKAHGLESCCSSISILSLLKELHERGISKRGNYEESKDFKARTGVKKGNLKICEYKEFEGQHMAVRALANGPLLATFNLQGLNNYKGEIYRGEYCKGLRFQNAHRNTVLITGLKKANLTGEFYFEALTARGKNWGYNGYVRIAVKPSNYGMLDRYGFCDMGEAVYQIKV